VEDRVIKVEDRVIKAEVVDRDKVADRVVLEMDKVEGVEMEKEGNRGNSGRIRDYYPVLLINFLTLVRFYTL
jgi:hypothetical protein